MMDSWLALPAGVVFASLSSMVGIGGGILWMPFLMIVLNLDPATAVITSLVIQSAGMGSGALAYWRQKSIDLRLAGLLLLFTIPGIGLGGWLTYTIRPMHLELVLGVLTLMTAMLFVSAGTVYGEAGVTRVETAKAMRYGWAVSIMGIASGMLSVSIGEWVVPLMRNKMDLRMGVAVATSIATIFGTCILAAAYHTGMGGHANLMILFYAIPGVIVGGQIGPRLAGRVNDRILMEMFVFLLTLIGIHLIYNSY
jgi:uncharacterized protein